ncbi:DUF1858 domain-containing protein [Geosporobacter ferrireducens]|uniref:Disulfide oxidoreductase n=1 Tax=Geosporobacter ferrireducens TaxID=1424294 RepID=A0A1D8GCC8_9FIRM|nr:DUF1858 domain-containing protein [Geosporobacter ferrireducens]AOT68551.1 disulfide oxidoreductase [Geosporobacter ferrireducens]MTI54016.1 DUF1858 domain-containing protein [Geosporobacter ferrireducens]
MKITRETLISEALKLNPRAAQILMGFGMGCLGCPSSQMESIGQAAEIHGIDLEKLLEALNQ